jgi:membrane fusion protein, multidrug efflux system
MYTEAPSAFETDRPQGRRGEGGAPIRKRRLGRAFFGMTLALIVVFGGLYGFNRFREAKIAEFFATNVPPPVPVEAATAIAAPLPQYISGIGSLIAVHQVTVAPEIGGQVVKIFFEAGAAVHAGDPLVRLNDQPEQGDLANYRAQARLAELNLARSKQLVGKQYTPQATVDQNQSLLDVADANIARVQAIIAQKLIRAPFDGQLGIRQVELGQFVTAGGPIVTLTDLDTLYADFTVPEQERPRLAVGQAVQVMVDAFPGRRFEGKLSTIEPQISTDTRVIKLRATLANPNHLLLPGMFANVRLVLPPEPNIVTLPETAVNYGLYGDSVFLISEDGTDGKGQPKLKAVRSFVKTGERHDGRVVILSGVKHGDRVAASGQVKIIPGGAVRIVDSDHLQKPDTTPVY